MAGNEQSRCWDYNKDQNRQKSPPSQSLQSRKGWGRGRQTINKKVIKLQSIVRWKKMPHKSYGLRGLLGWGNSSVLNRNDGYMSYHICQNPQKCTTQRVNINVNYEQQLIIMIQYWFINCNKCMTLRQDVNNRGKRGGRGGGGVGMLNSIYHLLNYSVHLTLY